ncbi:MAG: hypothetical protein QOJ03_909 [Frankiaceae bacterium]|jgi:hypothetical protein|nr:hypothetical protein [Frankiaceae bacterium]
MIFPPNPLDGSATYRRRARRFVAFAFLVAVCFAATGGVAALPAAHAAQAQVQDKSGAGAPAGEDPAERDAVNGKLGYHENRNYPYGLIGFLLVLTPVVLIAARRWKSTEGDA